MNWPRRIVAIAAVLCACMAMPARADLNGSVQAVTFPSEWANISGNNIHWSGVGASGRTVGWSFSLSEEKTLTHLGIWVYNTGNYTRTADRTIGVWNGAGNLVASAVLPAGSGGEFDFSGSPLNHPFIYQALDSNVVLGTGDYIIGAYYPEDNTPGLGFGFSHELWDPSAPFVDTGAVQETSGFTYGDTMLSENAAFEMPTINRVTGGSVDGGNRPNGYFGPNMRFLAVPEPTTAMLLVAGGAGLMLRRRRA